MRIIDGKLAQKNLRGNKYGVWNTGPNTALSGRPADASRRIFDDVAKIRPRYAGAPLRRLDPVFTMGSCFAREVEQRLVRMGGLVNSMDDSIDRPEFTTRYGRVRGSVLHRYTPAAMLQEFRQAFDEQPGWSEDALLFRPRRLPLISGGDDPVYDVNYFFPADTAFTRGLAATRVRRQVAKALVRNCVDARLIILTLGLTESWVHLPTGLHVNAMDARVLAAAPEAFELRVAETADILATLEEIYRLLDRVRGGRPFDLVITVSPVPVQATFTAQDVVVANMDSKSALRSAANTFVAGHKNAHYFPAYEMALYSDPGMAWNADRRHVSPRLVAKIVSSFVRAYYAPGEIVPD